MNTQTTPPPDEQVVDGTQDLFLAPDAHNLWVSIGPFSVYLIRTDEGLVVDVYARGKEMDDCVASLQVFEHEVYEDNEDDEAQV